MLRGLVGVPTALAGIIIRMEKKVGSGLNWLGECSMGGGRGEGGGLLCHIQISVLGLPVQHVVSLLCLALSPRRLPVVDSVPEDTMVAVLMSLHSMAVPPLELGCRNPDVSF